jgi:hypothetical protein
MIAPAGDRTTMLRRGDELWEQLAAALDASMDRPLGPSTDWTGHDVYAHFARWQAHAASEVRQLLVGGQPAPLPGDEDDINRRWAAEDRPLSHDEVRGRCIETRNELRRLLEGMNAEQWERFGRTCSIDISGEHYEHHLAAIASTSS